MPSRKKRLLIEEWLPAHAIGIESMRERNSRIQAPMGSVHTWWARRPLASSRSAVLASLLPAGFDRPTFERLLGFASESNEIIKLQEIMNSGIQLGGFGFTRSFENPIASRDLETAHEAMGALWGDDPTVIDPMAGGGSIPLESARLGIKTLANDYNPVACTLLEATIDYPFRFGMKLVEKVREYGKIWKEAVDERMKQFYPKENYCTARAYIIVRTIPCPTTGHQTPLVPSWLLLKDKHHPIVAMPKVDKNNGTWKAEIKEIGSQSHQLKEIPKPTFQRGTGTSLFTGETFKSDYVAEMGKQRLMKAQIYAVALKHNGKIKFRETSEKDHQCLTATAKELKKVRRQWENDHIIPTETIPEGDYTSRSHRYGTNKWAEMFSQRQLLALGVLVEELRKLRSVLVENEGETLGNAIEHILSMVIDKVANNNSLGCTWVTENKIGSTFQRHDFSFKATTVEIPLCEHSEGLAWAIKSTTKALERIIKLPAPKNTQPVTITKGSAHQLSHIKNHSMTAIVFDPPYADNVQYSELADFFYVWLKRTQKHRKPQWFKNYLCENNNEAVANPHRHRNNDQTQPKEAKIQANQFYETMMTKTFLECRRILRKDGVMTIMFNHKQQNAWIALFNGLIKAKFQITASYPILSEPTSSSHLIGRNSAQTSILITARPLETTKIGYYDHNMRQEIEINCRKEAERARKEGLNQIDQRASSSATAMKIFSQYSEVRDVDDKTINADQIIATAYTAVAENHVDSIKRQIQNENLEQFDKESLWYLLHWKNNRNPEPFTEDTIPTAKAIDLDNKTLQVSGLIKRKKLNTRRMKILKASERKRKEIINDRKELTTQLKKEQGKRKTTHRTINPYDKYFATTIDKCHALALIYNEENKNKAIELAKSNGWTKNSPTIELMTKLVENAPEIAKTDKNNPFPEFLAWHSLVEPLNKTKTPKWSKIENQQLDFTKP